MQTNKVLSHNNYVDNFFSFCSFFLLQKLMEEVLISVCGDQVSRCMHLLCLGNKFAVKELIVKLYLHITFYWISHPSIFFLLNHVFLNLLNLKSFLINHICKRIMFIWSYLIFCLYVYQNHHEYFCYCWSFKQN